MQAGKSTINGIFNQNKVLEIPFFQRAYVWKKEQWERFLEDMEMVSSTNRPYFLGSVILKQQLTLSTQSTGDKRTVIDGQQRLTTVCIFFKVLSLRFQNTYFETIFRLPLSNNDIALKHNHNDQHAFNTIMNLVSEDELADASQVTKAYNYFRTNIDISKINPQNILTNIMFVGVDLSHDDDEQQIFDTINSLGVKLTTAELLKNYFFGRNDYQQYIDFWQNVFEPNESIKKYWDTEIVAGRIRRHFIDLFFYSFLQIKIQDNSISVNTEDKKQFTKVDGLFESYKSFISNYNINKQDLLEEIRDFAVIFKANFNLTSLQMELPAESSIDRINAIIFGLENTTLIPYVLYVLKNVSDQTELNSIFHFLESYIMRRMVCHSNTKNYNTLFSESLIANKVLDFHTLKDFILKKSSDTNYFPTDQELEKGFKESRLVNKQASGILYLMETKIRNRTLHTTAMNGITHYSLEHVMPKKWKNHWPGVTTNEEKNYRNWRLMTMGNLTIISSVLNSTIRDAGWDVKKNGSPTRAGLIKYASGLDTFSNYLSESFWDESTIDNRAEFLTKKAKEIWNMN